MELLAAFEYRDVGIFFFSLHTRQVTLFHKGSFTNYAVTFGGGVGLPKDDERVSMKHDERWGAGSRR